MTVFTNVGAGNPGAANVTDRVMIRRATERCIFCRGRRWRRGRGGLIFWCRQAVPGRRDKYISLKVIFHAHIDALS